MKSENKDEKHLLFIGNLPPPIHGMSLIGQLIVDRLALEGWQIEKFNTSPHKSKRFTRITKFFPAWKSIIQHKKTKKIAYLTISGGYGQVYDLLTVALCRAFGLRCVLHHHSTAYLQSKNWLAHLLFSAAGKDSVHVVLCDKMQQQLDAIYGCGRVFVLSNMALFPAYVPTKKREKPLTLGYLSNITSDKGGREVIELAREVNSRNLPLDVIVGGPCSDKRIINALMNTELEGILQWRRGIYGVEKEQFWNAIDIFVFPTKYKNEAEPLVVWEALAAGVPIIAYDRGCIRCQIGNAGIIIPKGSDFVMDALNIIEVWIKNPAEYMQFTTASQLQYNLMHQVAQIQWQQLVDVLSNEI